MLFGRAFEKALAAFFLHQDASEVLFNEWASYRDLDLQYSANDNWDRMLQGGMQLLDRFAQEDRVRILQPETRLQVKILRPVREQRLRFLCRCDRRIRRRALRDRLEDQDQLLSSRTRRFGRTRPTDDLLLVDDGHWAGRPRRLRSQTDARDSMPQSHNQRSAAAGIRAVGGGDSSPDRGRTVSAAQWHTLSPEPMPEAAPIWAFVWIARKWSISG